MANIIAWVAIIIVPVSKMLPGLSAARNPSGMPTAAASPIAASASLMDGQSRGSITSHTGERVR